MTELKRPSVALAGPVTPRGVQDGLAQKRNSTIMAIWRVVQYPAGLIAGVGVALFSYLSIWSFPVRISEASLHTLVAFLGVFLASFCFLRGSRLAGAIFLLVIGVGFFYFELVFVEVDPDHLGNGWGRVAGTGVGAAIAVLSHAAWLFLLQKHTPGGSRGFFSF